MKARLFALISLFVAADVFAADIRPLPSPPIIGATSYLVIDSKTSHEIAALEPDNAVAPASLTKLMTAYATFHALKESQIALEDEVTISEKAWRAEGSRMFIEVGKRVSVQDLLLGMIVQSGNDASIALAEQPAHSACSQVTSRTLRACRTMTIIRQRETCQHWRVRSSMSSLSTTNGTQ